MTQHNDQAVLVHAEPTLEREDVPLKTTVPKVVEDHVSWALFRLREHEAAFEGVQRARGKGWFLALEVRDRQPAIAELHARLDEFRTLARANGIDPDAVIKQLGGEPDFAQYGPPAEPNKPIDPIENQSPQDEVDLLI